jgi:hypothetical protein
MRKLCLFVCHPQVFLSAKLLNVFRLKFVFGVCTKDCYDFLELLSLLYNEVEAYDMMSVHLSPIRIFEQVNRLS